jgi:hypothetical protein
VKLSGRHAWQGTGRQAWAVCSGGLLDGIEDPSNATVFSTVLSLARTAEMVSKRGVVYEAATRDVEERHEAVDDYLKRVQGEGKSFSWWMCVSLTSIPNLPVSHRESLHVHYEQG